MTDYKKYSLENLENWIHDCISCEGTTPQEIYDTIKKVVQEQYYYHKHYAGRCDELLVLLNDSSHISTHNSYINDDWKASPWNKVTSSYSKDEVKTCGFGDTSEYCINSWNDFWTNPDYAEDHFERDMMIYSMANKNDSQNQKVCSHSDAIKMGHTMTADGFWIPTQEENKDKIVKWQLPVNVDGLTGDCYVNFPDDLLEAANLKEGDVVEWVDNNNGTFTLRHVTTSNAVETDECTYGVK